jgi:hypothetical protein
LFGLSTQRGAGAFPGTWHDKARCGDVVRGFSAIVGMQQYRAQGQGSTAGCV